MTISSAVWIKYTNVTDGQTPGAAKTALRIASRGLSAIAEFLVLSHVSMLMHAECDIVMANPSVCPSVTL